MTDIGICRGKAQFGEAGWTAELHDEIISSTFVFSVALGPSPISQ